MPAWKVLSWLSPEPSCLEIPTDQKVTRCVRIRDEVATVDCVRHETDGRHYRI
ncbi:MAG: hypothetical protein ABII24_03175 [bacterium]